jgi:hypothetical protein
VENPKKFQHRPDWMKMMILFKEEGESAKQKKSK